MNACIITIGDELLIGQVVDTNSAWLGQQLNSIGVSVLRRIAVGDEKSEILDALREASDISSLIIITGGLGPTKDDITKDTLCEYFGASLVFNEEIYAMVKGFFDRFNRPMLESNRRQAEVPDNCEPIKNFNGTAPGMWFDHEGKVYVSVPGVPWEMKSMMTDAIFPKIKTRFKMPVVIHRTILTQGIGESFLAEKIKDIEDAFPAGFKLAYLPNLSAVRLRISAVGNNKEELQTTIAGLSARLEERLADYIWGFDADLLEAVIGHLLREQNATVCSAESCTGGLIAHRIVSIAGASDYFVGSIVSYSDEMKIKLLGVNKNTLQQFGAVSEETVREMTQGALKNLGATYAIGVSGIAGPAGATEEKPVGTVWIAVGRKDNIVAKKFVFPGNRERNMELSAINALSMLRKFILGLPVK